MSERNPDPWAEVERLNERLAKLEPWAARAREMLEQYAPDTMGCTTGDCPHEFKDQCADAMNAHIKEQGLRCRALLDEWPGEEKDA